MSTKVIAHRGFSERYPENTHIAFQAALKEKIQGIETDFQLSKDEEVMCFHDRTLSKCGFPASNIHNCTKEECQAMDVGLWKSNQFKGQQMPTLKDVLDAYGKKTLLLLEIKIREVGPRLKTLGEKIAHEVTMRNMSHPILSFDLELLMHIKNRFPEANCVLNTKIDCTKMLTTAAWDCLEGISFHQKAFHISAGDACRKQQKSSYIYTVNDATALKKVLPGRPDYIMSDNPGWLAESLGQR